MMLKSLVTPVHQATESIKQKKTCQNSKQKQSFLCVFNLIVLMYFCAKGKIVNKWNEIYKLFITELKPFLMNNAF